MATLKILVVDDEETVRQNLISFFETLDLEVRGANTSEQALKLVEEFSPDAMFLDLRLEDNSEVGLQVLKKTKQMNPNIKVFIVSGMSAAEFEVKVKRLGAEAYLAKPISLPEMNEIIDQQLREKESQ